jgi:CoA:oxalate CoA-transferase
MTAPLDGIRVLDLTRVLAGPHCTRTLCDLGAEVIKVEPPAGDSSRFQAPRRHGMPSYFVQQNVGKRCISVDLQHPDGRSVLLDLVEHCDVVVENFRPGVMDRLGIGYDRLVERRPDVILVSISGYGQTGPWRDRMAYASVVGGEAGFTKSQGDQRGGHYQNDRHSHADVYTGIEAALAVTAALFQRQTTGVGQHIDISMAETLLYVNEHVHDDLWEGQDDPDWVRSFGNEHHPVVRTADGAVVIIAGNPAQKGVFETFLAAIDRNDLASDPRFATVEARKENMPALQAAIAEFAARVADAEALIVHCERNGLAAGELRSVRDVGESDWAAARGAIVTVADRGGGTIRVPNSPWHFGAAPDVGVHGEPRYRGEDNAAVLHELLGLDQVAIAALAAAGVISAHLPR